MVLLPCCEWWADISGMRCKPVSALFIHVAQRGNPDSDAPSRPLINLTDKSLRRRDTWAKRRRKLDSRLIFTANWNWRQEDREACSSVINECQTVVGSHPALKPPVICDSLGIIQLLWDAMFTSVERAKTTHFTEDVGKTENIHSVQRN